MIYALYMCFNSLFLFLFYDCPRARPPVEIFGQHIFLISNFNSNNNIIVVIMIQFLKVREL